ncbi:hypothetical protein ACGFNU_48010 [Spirillospora sp. NPDC048911]|uniref:hypothetical protein n=1 Tax=Spirillospora sp. NPDC048911 TaxID=3364527 RepID=UPI0037121AFC
MINVCRGDLVRHERDLHGHQPVERLAALGVGLQVRPEGPAEHVLVHGPSGEGDLEQPGQRDVRASKPALDVQPGGHASMALAGQQQAGQVGEGEHAWFRLREHAFGDEVAQQPFQSGRIGPAPVGELIGAARAVLDQIRQPQGGGDPNGIGRHQVGKRTQPPRDLHSGPAARCRGVLFRYGGASSGIHCHDYVLPVFSESRKAIRVRGIGLLFRRIGTIM